MLKVFCNGCGREITDGRSVKSVRLTEATVDGPEQEPGLKPDHTTEGHLCLQTCDPLIRALVSESVATSEFGVALDEMAKTLFARNGGRVEESRRQARETHVSAMDDLHAHTKELGHDPANGQEGGLQMSEQETSTSTETETERTTTEQETTTPPDPNEPQPGDGGEEGDEGGTEGSDDA